MYKRLAWLWAAGWLVATSLATAATVDETRHLPPNDYPSHTVKILRTTNKAQTQSYVPVVFTMRNNNPFNVIQYLHRPIQHEEGLLFTFVSPEGNGGHVLYCVPEYMIESLGRLVAALDRPGLTTSAGTTRIYRQLKHRRASATDPGFIETAASFSTGNGNEFLIDPWANALYYEDADSGAMALDNALTDWLDVPTAMVDVMVKVYELAAYNDATIGLDYISWKNGPGRDLFAVGLFSEYASVERAGSNLSVFPPNADPSALGLRQGLSTRNNLSASGWNYAWSYNVDSSFFDYLQTKGKARVLNRARLSMLNSWPAYLDSGDQVMSYAVGTSNPSGIRDSGEIFQANTGRLMTGTTNQIVTREPEDLEELILNLVLNGFDSGLSGLSPYSYCLEPIETGFFLALDNVIGEQSVTLEVDMEWSDYTAFDDTGFPQIQCRKLHIEDLRLALGDEIIIGGLKRQAHAVATQKVPFFGSLPIVGYLFGGEDNLNKQTELVVAIKPVEITSYQIARDDQAVIDKATGQAEIVEPDTTMGFDQYIFDKARDVEAMPFN
ncbi:MAG: Bacterial type II and III secretion system protein [candidate division BRC1 bacterium ADurb.BinA292]|nr:MAG: Bacterial type II and III secretion system protein [candidate division BRC1 bacterium ADurb.BinA292]